jgi:hypothetical protein
MEELLCTLESVSGCGLTTLQVFTPKPIKKKKVLNNLIDYLILCDGGDYVDIFPPNDVHKEALKVKCLYPHLKIEVTGIRIQISF